MRAFTKALRVLILLIASTAANVAISACEDSGYRQFDFWIGDWEVRTPDGKVVGQNRITREYGGCVIHERYTTSRGYAGESLNSYDAGRRRWHQTWVDTEGALLLLEGELKDGRMVLDGETLDSQGKQTRHRITWTRNEDGSVRQFWQSADASGAWTTAFDGIYSPAKIGAY